MSTDSQTRETFTNASKALSSKAYRDAINNIKEELGLENYPQAQIEAMLIEATKEFFLKDGDNADARLDIDTVLVDFGLLKGYDNRNRSNSGMDEATEKEMVTERRANFLENSVYITKRKIKSCQTYRDLKNKEKRKKSVNALGDSTRLRIIKVAKHIYSKKHCIEQYINEITKDYDFSNPEYLEEKWLPALSSVRPEPSKEGCVSDCLNSIRLSSEPYDDIAKDLYKALCDEDELPYDKWVETWLIKCIQEKFQDTIDKDIMLASFALAPDYALDSEDGLKGRMNEYLLKSIYYDTHPCESRKPIGYILGMGKDEERQIKAKLEEREKKLFSELVEYIKNIENCHEHIKKLENYGTGKHHSYSPTPQKILFSRENIESSQKIQKERKEIVIFVVTGILVFLFCVFSLQIYEPMHEEQVRKEAVFSYIWEKDESSQTESWITRSINDNDDSSGVEPVYAKNSQFSNGNFSEDT